MNPKVLTDDQVKTIKEYRKKKMTLRAIAKIFGVSHETVRQALLRASIILLTVACGTDESNPEKQAAAIDQNVYYAWYLETDATEDRYVVTFYADGTYKAIADDCDGYEVGTVDLTATTLKTVVTESEGDCTDSAGYITEASYRLENETNLYINFGEAELHFSRYATTETFDADIWNK